MAVIQLSAANVLIFEQSAESNIKWKHIRHRLPLTDALHSSPSVQNVNQKLWYQHVVSVTKEISLTASNVLSFSQESVPRVFVEIVPSHLILIQAVHVDSAKAASNVLQLSQLATYELVKYAVVDTITFEQIADFKIIKIQELNQAFTMTQGVSVYKPNKNFIMS